MNSDDSGSMVENQSPGEPLWPLWLVVAAVGAHIIEEYALNFVAWANTALHAPISWEDFHLVNFGVIVYCIACAAVGRRSPGIALSSAALVILNAVGFHGGSSVITGAYSPGTASALVLFVPSGLAAYAAARRAGLLTTRTWIVSAGIGLAWHAFLAGVFALKYFAPLYG